MASPFGGSRTGGSWRSDARAYIGMFAHLKWWLISAGLLVLAIVIAIERLVWMMVRKTFA